MRRLRILCRNVASHVAVSAELGVLSSNPAFLLHFTQKCSVNSLIGCKIYCATILWYLYFFILNGFMTKLNQLRGGSSVP